MVTSLLATPFRELPLGQVMPTGWLKNQLQIQAEGFTGKLPNHWKDLSDESGWLGGEGESWERGPYYLDGLVPLAYLLNDEKLINMVEKWIEWTLSSQKENGQFGPEKTKDDWWSRMVMLKVLAQYEEATGDERVIPFLSKYFRFQIKTIDQVPLKGWGKARGAENVFVIHWLHERTREDFLLNLAEKIQEHTINWTNIFTEFPYWRYINEFDHRTHVVNVLMALKEPAFRYLHSKDELHKNAPRLGIQNIMSYHGQLHGACSGDEWLAGTHPSQGLELCGVVEYMYSLENLIRVFGDGSYGDILEKITYNALPATISSDWTSHQYVQQVNQVKCTFEKRNWTENGDDANTFGLEPNFGCCTANMHQGWPKFTSHLWMATDDQGVAAIAYAPCQVNTVVAEDVKIQLDIKTSYPFDEDINIHINISDSAKFPIKLRIPEWCDEPSIKLDGVEQKIILSSGFAEINRKWSNNEQIDIQFPMKVRFDSRANGASGVLRGPLVYALPLGENWIKRAGNLPFADWEVFNDPVTPWNYGLKMDSSFEVMKRRVPYQPFHADAVPVWLIGEGQRIPQWQLEKNSAGELPLSPVHSSEAVEKLTLVPYGSARLRIAEFPVLAKQLPHTDDRELLSNRKC